jgi:hypothetical protein
MKFNEHTLKIGGLIRVPHSAVNKTDYGVIRDKTKHGVYVIYHEGTDKQQKCYLSYGWLNWRYGDGGPNKDLNDDISDIC